MLILSIINIRQIRMLRFIPRRKLRQYYCKLLVRLSTILTPISILFHSFAFNHLMPPKLRFFIETTKKKDKNLQLSANYAMRQPSIPSGPSSHNLLVVPHQTIRKRSPDHAITETDDRDRSNTLIPIAAIAWYRLQR